MQELILIVHTLSAAALIALVLLQQGKGADVGAAFGSGASQTLFGARGAANFLTRMTAVLATVFFLTSLSLVYFFSRQTTPTSVTMPQGGQAPTTETPKIPESPGPAAPPPVPK